jgi:hypothetical protein
MTETLETQIDRLANFIMAEVPDEPSQSEGAVDTAIRWMRSALAARSAPEAGKAVDETTTSNIVTPKQFRTLFAILHNIELAQLVNAGIINGDTASWKRFNDNLTTFVLKLSDDHLERLVELVHDEGLSS